MRRRLNAFSQDRDALGQILHVSGKPARDVRVIGVAADIVTCCIPWGKDAALLYLPTTPATSANVLVHVRGEVEAERHRLDMRLAALAPGAIGDIHSLDQYRAVGIYGFRAASMIGAALGGLALLLTLTGIYGVVSYFVTQRTKEIGIRVALGATTRTVVGLVLKQSLRLTAIGIVLGTGLAIGVSRLLASQHGLHARVRWRGLRCRRVAGCLRRACCRIHPVPQGSSNRPNPDASLRLRNAALIGQREFLSTAATKKL